MIRRVLSLWKRAAQAATVSVPPPTFSGELAGAGRSVEQWCRDRQQDPRLYTSISPERLQALAGAHPARVQTTLDAAERILRHEFDMLGSGAFVPVDPGRASRMGYAPIDWYLDPIQRLRFPERIPHRQWNLMEMRPGLADVKIPWELSRSQHWPTLGQAFLFTSDERFAREVFNELDDFLEANPVGMGINWTCTMDVAIRAFNWAISLELIRASAAADDHAMQRAYEALFDHGVFIERNLENTYEVTSNHFLSNVLGLYALGVVFHDLPCGTKWLRRCRDWLEQEMRVQILPDGADYESSIPYHRLVAELFLSGARLAEMEGQPLSAFYRERLRLMVEFLIAVLRPDGLLPQVGDADDGRLHIVTDYGSWRPQDARHLLAPAGHMFREPAWLTEGGEAGEWEAAWWGFNPEALAPTESPRRISRLFRDAGIAVARSGDSYLLATNGRVGTNGFGNHKHNDLLSFEFHPGGCPLIVDPGSYVYTSDPEARNLFRGTRYHNTICVDDTEQNEMKPEHLFRLYETSTVEHLGFDEMPAFTEYRGKHTGYSRLRDPVVHERSLRLVGNPGALVLIDRLCGTGSHRLRWHFHLAPGVAVVPADRAEFSLSAGFRRFRFRAPDDLTGSVVDAWYSPSYGVRVPCLALEFTLETVVDENRTYLFAVGPEGWRP